MTSTPIDAAVLEELEQTTGADFVGELVSAFLAEAPGMIEELKAAAETSNEDQFRRAAHSIKSNANIFGAHDLAAVARTLEMTGLGAAQAEEPIWIEDLTSQFERTAETLKAYLDA